MLLLRAFDGKATITLLGTGLRCMMQCRIEFEQHPHLFRRLSARAGGVTDGADANLRTDAVVFRSPSNGQENAAAPNATLMRQWNATKVRWFYRCCVRTTRNGSNVDEEYPMRTRTLFLIATVSLGALAPAMAYDTGSLLSMDEALGVATDIGLASVSDAEFAGTEWQIEGRDISGRYMEVDVDATTGEVLNVDR
jgi:hypothetical protein